MCNVPHFYNFFFPRLRSTSFDTSSFYNVPIWCKQLYHSQPLDDDQRGDAVFRDLAASIVHGGHGNLRDRAALPEAQHKVPMLPGRKAGAVRLLHTQENPIGSILVWKKSFLCRDFPKPGKRHWRGKYRFSNLGE